MSYTEIATRTLTSNQTEVGFTNIPQTFRDLVVVAFSRNQNVGSIALRFNDDANANYQNVGISWDGSSPINANAGNLETVLRVTAGFATGDSDSWARTIVQIHNYTSTTQHKSVLMRSGVVYEGFSGQPRTQTFTAGRYAVTSPSITRIS